MLGCRAYRQRSFDGGVASDVGQGPGHTLSCSEGDSSAGNDNDSGHSSHPLRAGLVATVTFGT